MKFQNLFFEKQTEVLTPGSIDSAIFIFSYPHLTTLPFPSLDLYCHFVMKEFVKSFEIAHQQLLKAHP